MRRAQCAVFALVLARLLASCGSDGFDPAWRVKSFRVVGVTLDPPDANGGETIRMGAVLADTAMHANRPVSVAWAVCPHIAVDPESGSRGCAPTETTVLAGTDVTFVAPSPNGMNSVGIFGFACAGGTLGFNTATQQPTCAGGDGFAFIRSLRVRAGAANHNPGIARVLLDGAELAADMPGRAPLCHGDRGQCRAIPLVVEFAADAREPTQIIQPDGSTQTQPEALITEFLVDGGDLDGSFRSDGDADLGTGMNPHHANTFVPPSTAGEVKVWVLVQDGRGGFSAAVRRITVN